jgi:hypothetical protein
VELTSYGNTLLEALIVIAIWTGCWIVVVLALYADYLYYWPSAARRSLQDKCLVASLWLALLGPLGILLVAALSEAFNRGWLLPYTGHRHLLWSRVKVVCIKAA